MLENIINSALKSLLAQKKKGNQLKQTFHIPSMHVLDESIASWFICGFISNQPNLAQQKKYLTNNWNNV